ncbi:flagellar basal body rod C-terminal domain-containing protein [Desulfonatronovibrio magnus]|uniref:flagellar basal body rod C-terminal domain-containing protein n=1 Tax=Desulfonatronovibrio magnus TaxID=698827 RepID=UPI0005EAE46B|nr:flagellar basal body rod C-terminal domain-containing protein [Desulfonatronovibrio magnus]
MSIAVSAGAMSSFGLSQNITAHNVANINTDEFKSQRLDLETGPQGQGVRPAQIVEDQSMGPLVQRQQAVENEQGLMVQQEVAVEASNTDLAREITGMIRDERAFESNAQAIRSQENLIGVFLDKTV